MAVLDENKEQNRQEHWRSNVSTALVPYYPIIPVLPSSLLFVIANVVDAEQPELQLCVVRTMTETGLGMSKQNKIATWIIRPNINMADLRTGPTRRSL